ncbi:Importin subunit beta-1 [Sarcoptes scabiei]|nr:Importin subunit beta-1 [Sarcoptes scabiei]
MNILHILEKAISQDQNEIRQAYELCEKYSLAHYGDYLTSLSQLLVNKTINGHIRTLAGLQIKNQLTSKDKNQQKLLAEKWYSLPLQTKNQVKINVINSLGTETGRPSAASQCIAYIISLEINQPQNDCAEIIKSLTLKATDKFSDEALKIACLEAIGYLRQEVKPEFLVVLSNEMLTAIVNNMRNDEPSNAIKLTATTALLNSLDHIKMNFETENERHFIMQVVCEATQSNDINIQVAALECLVKIMSLFYQYMEHYMSPALFPITMQAINDVSHPDICLQGIEFWSNVCEEEIKLQYEASEAAEKGRPPQSTSKFYAKGALGFLVMPLLNTLLRQDEDADDDEWNPCKAASVCLALLAECTGDAIMPYVSPFFQNIRSTEWQHRDAALMALGSILDGPSKQNLFYIVEEAIPQVLAMTNDQHVCVRDTATWVLSVICQQIYEIVFKPSILKCVLDVLIATLKSEPRIAVHSCLAIGSLAENANDLANPNDSETVPDSNALSEYYEEIITHLFQCTERVDSLLNNLRSSAYEALIDMIKYCPKNQYGIVRKTSELIMDRLNRMAVVENASHLDQNYLDLQSLLCSTLQAILRRMSSEDALIIAESVVKTSLKILEICSKNGSINEDVIMMVSTLANSIEQHFKPFLPSFHEYLILGLKSYMNPHLLSVSIGFVNDLCQSLEKDIAPMCDEFLIVLMEILQNPEVPQTIKSQILDVFGDIALALGSLFEKFLNPVLQALCCAISAAAQTTFEMPEQLHDFWDSILHAFSGIVNTLKDENNKPNMNTMTIFRPHIPLVNQFIIYLAARYEELPDSVVASLAGLIGDLISLYNGEMFPLVDDQHVQQMLNTLKKSKQPKVKSAVAFVFREVKRAKAFPSQIINPPGPIFSAMQNTATAS